MSHWDNLKNTVVRCGALAVIILFTGPIAKGQRSSAGPSEDPDGNAN